MIINKRCRYYMCDFETTVYKNQTKTEVWAAGIIEMQHYKKGALNLKNPEPIIYNNIESFLNFFFNQDCDCVCYFHNLKFDGSFILDWLLRNNKFSQAYTQADPNDFNTLRFIPRWEMNNYQYGYLISDMGQWYNLIIRINDHLITFLDSLKLLPFSVKRIGESFKTEHRKLEIEYEGERVAGGIITKEEQDYLANDLYVVKEALETMFAQGHTKTTIGSCCLQEYKRINTELFYNEYFPDLSIIELDPEEYGSRNVDEYVRKSYRGGWCYLVKGKENKQLEKGFTADVNSLYPSMMSGESGNYYPVGKPIMFFKRAIPEWVDDRYYYFVRIKTKFKLKKNHLPCIQIKHNLLYKPTEWLTQSKVIDNETGTAYDYPVTLTLTQTDFKLIQDHYDLIDLEILDGCYFTAETALFDDYIDKYRKIKMESKGALRELAKLFLNNLYGKMATSARSGFKVARLIDGEMKFLSVVAYDKKTGYIPVGSAITSYARNFTIRAAQANFHGANKQGFVYADTDSIHCDMPVEDVKGIKIHDKNFCCWKIESCWDKGLFVRQKTYVEHVVQEDLEPVEPHYVLKCAGLPEKCKRLFLCSIGEDRERLGIKENKLSEKELEFINTKRTISDFKIGLKIYGKLLPKRINGGVVLVDTEYEMR